MPLSENANPRLQFPKGRQHRAGDLRRADRDARIRIAARAATSSETEKQEYGRRGSPMTTEEALFDMEERMEKAVAVYRDELRGLRTGRATPALLDSLR